MDDRSPYFTRQLEFLNYTLKLREMVCAASSARLDDDDDDDEEEEEEEQFVGSHPLLSWHAYFAQSVHECSSTHCSQNTKSCC